MYVYICVCIYVEFIYIYTVMNTTKLQLVAIYVTTTCFGTSCVLHIATNCSIFVFLTLCIYRYIHATAFSY